MTIAERIAALEAELEPLNLAAYEAFWQLQTTGDEKWERESARLDTEIRTARLADHIRSTVDDAPPLTVEQRDRLALLLRGGPDAAA